MSHNENYEAVAPSVHPALKKHGEIVSRRDVIKVTDHVYVAIGYALANVIMVEGEDGIVIVDTTESGDGALRILKEFRKITSKPIKAIILTHFHADHINGTDALLKTCKDGGKHVQVIAHSTMYSEARKQIMQRNCYVIGSIMQFGSVLKPGEELVCCGIGPQLNPIKKPHLMVKPTYTFDNEAEIKTAGINFTLLHTPGETNDQITIWIPEWKVVMPADNIYRTFPNLYAIRGTPPRNCENWYRSLDKVRRLGAKYMVPSHTEPVEGEKKIYDVITHYRDAIQFVNDQTTRLLNNGLDVDEIVKKVRLPPSLASHPYLQEHYGMVSWSVRSVISGLIGWFDRSPDNLFPLSKDVKSEYLRDLLEKEFPNSTNGVEKMLLAAEEIVKENAVHTQTISDSRRDETVWSLQLSLQALQLSSPGSDLYKRAESAAISALHSLASDAVNPNARNFFLTKSKNLTKDGVKKSTFRSEVKALAALPVDWLMKKLPLSLRAEACSDQETMTIVLAFPDVDQVHSYTLRHCVLEYCDEPEFIPSVYDVKVSIHSDHWKQLLTNEINLELAMKRREISIEGNVHYLKRFINLSDISGYNFKNRL